MGLPAGSGPHSLPKPSPNLHVGCVDATLMRVGIEYYPYRYDGLPSGFSKNSPISSAATSALRHVYTIKDFLTAFVSVRAKFQFWYDLRRWSALAPIIISDLAAIHCGLGDCVSVGVCLSISLSA